MMSNLHKPRSNNDKNLLVVDDHGPILRALNARFTHAGFNVQSAKDSSSAIACLHDFEPKAALLDINMPGLDGFKVAQEIQTRVPGCEIIFITASKNQALREQADAIGAFAFMEKPFDAQDLMEQVASAMSESADGTDTTQIEH